ncbi:MAG: sodium:proton antiporter [Bacteroidales bacterium]|nr:sodium:proton antiporter [Bacteroidales bacterium]
MHDQIFIPPLWASLPFLFMLLTIALGPLFFNTWWEHNKNKLFVSFALAIPTTIYMLINGLGMNIVHNLVFDYVPFIILLGSLFVITGGIKLEGDIPAHPITNTIFLAIGAILASIMGTTGAAMLLIRPVINTNSERKFKTHTILFFIAIVANCGGLLTPLGDPPLFLLYLKGAVFTWFLTFTKEWATVNGLLLLIYFIYDTYYYKKELPQDIIRDETEIKPIRISGKFNFLFLLGIVLSVAFINENYIPAIRENHYLSFLREAAMLMFGILSVIFTSKKLRTENKFTWGPIIEVAYLFLGIFVTMVPSLIYLQANAASLGLTTPAAFYYAAGSLSSFLDNAPTALAFYEVAKGMLASFPGANIVAGIPEALLAAISLGAVFFGSMSYIGNGPNFMIKAIAEENKISMPGFFGYMLKFSLVVLLPVYILVQLLFI